jgi:hypothetical protein
MLVTVHQFVYKNFGLLCSWVGAASKFFPEPKIMRLHNIPNA